MRVRDGRVPEADRAVLGAAHQRFVIRQQGQRPNLLTMTSQRIQALLSRHVPDADRLVGAARGQLFAIRPEYQGTDLGAVPFQLPDLFASGDIA